jgi:hypothetical protein
MDDGAAGLAKGSTQVADLRQNRRGAGHGKGIAVQGIVLNVDGDQGGAVVLGYGERVGRGHACYSG